MDTWLFVLVALLLCSVPGGHLQQTYCHFLCTCDNRGNVYCTRKMMPRVPNDLPRNTTGLFLNDNMVSVLRDNEFLTKDMKQLQRIHINDNNIVVVEDKAFNGLANLSVVSLWHNGITVFNKDILRDNLKVEEVDLSGNPLVLPRSEKVSLLSSASLVDLSLSACNLTSLTRGLFSETPNITFLWLHDNRLTALNWFALHQLRRLELLDLHGNAMRDVPCEAEILLSLSELYSARSVRSTVFLLGNSLTCDCCLALTNHAIHKRFHNVIGRCKTKDGSIRQLEAADDLAYLKQCYVTFMKDTYNVSVAGINNWTPYSSGTPKLNMTSHELELVSDSV